ncbi:MAG: bifunctional oligoribonuclease/PAP phosphatase NrnA [Oscillospiraceae bacterium]|nr:bifunctional oligoribonuclease/PAP phosphatase NrnA [Oscillospiraceae bacterium]
MDVNTTFVADLLKKSDDILILSHKNPDGDTIGSAFALYYALKELGKKSAIKCQDKIPNLFGYLKKDYKEFDLKPQLIVAVDVADTQLLGEKLECYADKIDVCIDHHVSNKGYAKHTLVDADAAANCEIMLDVIEEMGVKITRNIANALYTGIATDTGCFKFSNTTAKTHSKASKLMEYEADFAKINRDIFDTKSWDRIMLEQMIYNSVEFYLDGKCSVITITKDMLKKTGVDESEVDGISGLARSIEGVEAGVTIREKSDGAHKVSVRTGESIDASAVCQRLGGGGHIRAAGCVVEAQLGEVKQIVVEQIEKEIASKN